MELKDYVQNVLQQISEGIAACNGKDGNVSSLVVNPAIRTLVAMCFVAHCSVAMAQDSLLVSYKLNLVRDPISKMYGYAFKEQNVTSPIHGTASTAINMFGKAGSVFISKDEAENIDWAIPPQYEDAAKGFKENMAMVKVGGKTGFIDMHNRFVIEPIYDGDMDMEGFTQGIVAMKLDGKWGYINKYGDVVIDFIYDEADNFDDDMIAAVKVGELWGAIDIEGNMVLEPSKKTKLALKTNPMSNKEWREAKAQAEERKANGTFDKRLASLHTASTAMNEMIAFNSPEEITYTQISVGDSIGIVDQWGRVIVPAWFSEIQTQPDEGTFIVKRNNLYGAYLYNGSKLIRPCFDSMTPFLDGVSEVTAENVKGWLDVSGYLDPDFLASIAQLGIDQQRKSPAEARRIYERILSINPEYAMAYNNIALIDIEWKDYNKGMRKLKLAHELEPEDTIISNNLKWAKESRKERRKERWNEAFEIIGVVLNTTATVYSTYSAIHGGETASAGTSGTNYVNNSSGSTKKASSKASQGRCSACGGTGTCSGAGYGVAATKQRCHGSGKCFNCDNGKHYVNGQLSKCTFCNNTGVCKFCRGTGKCEKCHGTGN